MGAVAPRAKQRPQAPRSKRFHLIRRPRSPYWYVEYIDSDGQRVRVTTKESDKVKATRIAKAMVSQALDQDPTPLPITLGEALRRYVESLEARGKPSAKRVGDLARKIVGKVQPRRPHPKASEEKAARFRARAAQRHKPRWHLKPDMPLNHLRPSHLEELVTERSKEGLAASTIGHELKTLRAAVKLAEELGFQAPRIVKWRVPTGTMKTRFLTPEEFGLFYAELTPSDGLSPRAATARLAARDFAVLLAHLGGRWQEIATLQWTGVDLAARVVTLWGSKTQRMRRVPITDAVYDVLTKCRSAQNLPGTPEAIRTSRFVFPQSNGKPRVTVCRPLVEAMDRAGLNHPARVAEGGRATVHSLRHTHASWLLAGGADLSDVQLALGHTTLQMTQRYAHLTGDEALKRLANALERGGPKTG